MKSYAQSKSKKVVLKMPDYKLTGYRINASTAENCWPGPGVRVLEPTEEELAPYGSGGGWPMR
eukprot:1402539-Rhodomonas_salina.8